MAAGRYIRLSSTRSRISTSLISANRCLLDCRLSARQTIAMSPKDEQEQLNLLRRIDSNLSFLTLLSEISALLAVLGVAAAGIAWWKFW